MCIASIGVLLFAIASAPAQTTPAAQTMPYNTLFPTLRQINTISSNGSTLCSVLASSAKGSKLSDNTISLGQILLLTVLLWPIAALIRRHYGQRLTLTPRERRLRLLMRIVCLLDLTFFAAFAGFFAMAFKDIGLLSPHYNPWLRLIQIVGWLGILGTLIVIYNAVRSWKQPERWLWTRLADILIALACVGVIWFVFTWNMLHWTLRY